MKITDEVIIEGINKSLSNAKALFEEGSILEHNNRLERAYFLFQISIEELGKATLLIFALLSEEHKDAQKFKLLLKNFRNHKIKTEKAIGIDLLLLDVTQDADFRAEYIKGINLQYNNIEKINDYKNFSLYTHFENGEFHLPSFYINMELLGRIRQIVELRLLASKDLYSAIINDLSNFRPMYQRESKVITPEKIDEWGRNLMDN